VDSSQQHGQRDGQVECVESSLVHHDVDVGVHAEAGEVDLTRKGKI